MDNKIPDKIDEFLIKMGYKNLSKDGLFSAMMQSLKTKKPKVSTVKVVSKDETQPKPVKVLNRQRKIEEAMRKKTKAKAGKINL